MTSASNNPVIRKVVFHSEDLGEDVTLIFLFDDYDTKLDAPMTSHPVVWKKGFFGKTGNYLKKLEYTNQLTFTKPDPGDIKFHFPATGSTTAILGRSDTRWAFNNPTTISAWGALKPSHPLILRRTEDGKDFKLSPTEGASGDSAATMVLRNECGEKVDAVLGFRERVGSLPRFARVFRNIGDGRPVNVSGFKPILRAYVTSSYEEGEGLLQPPSGQLIWSQNLDALAEETQWKVTYDPASGNFVVGQTA